MVSMTDIEAGMAGLKTAFDIARGIRDIADAAERNSKIVDLQRSIMDAQAGAIQAQQLHTEDVKRIAELEAEIAHLRTWEGEKQRYVLYSPQAGATVYALKPGMEAGEPPHWLCANCYQQSKKSILQGKSTQSRTATWECPNCTSVVTTWPENHPK